MTVEEIGDYLTGLGFGDINRNGVPPGKTKCIALIPYATGARASEHDFGSALLKRERPRITVYTRGEPENTLEPAQRAYALYLAIGGMSVPMTISGVLYRELTVLMPPYPLKIDDNKCSQFVFGVEFYKDVSPSPL